MGDGGSSRTRVGTRAHETGDHRDPVALVVGSSSGIGKTMSEEFERLGYRVVRAARWTRTAIPPDRRQVLHVGFDASDPAATLAAVNDIEAGFGPIEVLICCAGDLRVSPVSETTWDDTQGVLRANLAPFVNGARAVLPHMIARRRGRIVAVGSGWSLMPTAGVPAYACAKAALAAYAGSLAAEAESHGVGVHVLFPGYVPSTALAEQARLSGLREPMRLLWTRGRTLRKVAESLTRGRPPHVIYVNVMERFAPAVPSLSQRLFWTACRTMQPFPSYLGEGRRGRWTA